MRAAAGRRQPCRRWRGAGDRALRIAGSGLPRVRESTTAFVSDLSRWDGHHDRPGGFVAGDARWIAWFFRPMRVLRHVAGTASRADRRPDSGPNTCGRCRMPNT